MINANEDPWQFASLLKSRGTLTAVTISCTNCAHCIDLHTPSSSDAKPLKKARADRLKAVQGWIAEYWKSANKKKRLTVDGEIPVISVINQ